MLRWSPSIQARACLTTFLLLLSLIEGQVYGASREQLIPILGVTTGQNQIGTVSYVRVSFEKRQDEAGLLLRFDTTPGRFSRMAQTSIEQGIRRSAQSLGISTNSWTVELSVPYAGMTIYGDSVSAMVSLSVAAMAQGKTLSTGHVLTGTVTPDGAIGPVGSIPLKVQAARAAKLRRVVVSRQNAPAESEGNLPISFEVSPVDSVPEALDALTDPSPSESEITEAEPQ
jgi:PDZ domain-containing secreted protein